MSTTPVITETSKLYEMIARNPKLLQLLPRFGIQLGFGDHSIHEVCQANHVDTQFFLLIAGFYSEAQPTITPDELETINMDDLLPYLLASHRYYLGERFPHIEEHLLHIINKYLFIDFTHRFCSFLKLCSINYFKRVALVT